MRARSLTNIFMALLGLLALAAPAAAQSLNGGTRPGTVAPTTGSSGGREYATQDPAATPIVAGAVAKLLPDGTAAAPADAPVEIQEAIWAANRIVGLPYHYGGGHGRFRDTGYDCSGTVSYALHGGRLLAHPLDSSSFMRWGAAGRGLWVTVYTNPGHAFATIAGLRLDTSRAGDLRGKEGPRWRPVLRVAHGYKARHPLGL